MRKLLGVYPYSDTSRTYAPNTRIYEHIKGCFPHRWRPQNRDSTRAILGNALKCRCRVIDRLEYFIPRRIRPAKPGHLGRGIRIEGLLQHCIERACSKTTTVHWREHLHIANRMEAKPLGNPLSHDAQELGLDLLGTVCRNDVEVTGA